MTTNVVRVIYLLIQLKKILDVDFQSIYDIVYYDNFFCNKC